MFKRWRTFTPGNRKLTLYGKRALTTGIGSRLGCGHNIVAIVHSYSKNGVELWSRVSSYEVEINNKQSMLNSKYANMGRETEIHNGQPTK